MASRICGERPDVAEPWMSGPGCETKTSRRCFSSFKKEYLAGQRTTSVGTEPDWLHGEGQDLFLHPSPQPCGSGRQSAAVLRELAQCFRSRNSGGGPRSPESHRGVSAGPRTHRAVPRPCRRRDPSAPRGLKNEVLDPVPALAWEAEIAELIRYFLAAGKPAAAGSEVALRAAEWRFLSHTSSKNRYQPPYSPVVDIVPGSLSSPDREPASVSCGGYQRR